MYMFTATPSAITVTFICSPMPSQRMSSGSIANDGMARLICSGPSRRYSPVRLSPAATARITPATTPKKSPRPARWSEISTLSWRRPLWIRSVAVDTTAPGPDRIRGSR